MATGGAVVCGEMVWSSVVGWVVVGGPGEGGHGECVQGCTYRKTLTAAEQLGVGKRTRAPYQQSVLLPQSVLPLPSPSVA